MILIKKKQPPGIFIKACKMHKHFDDLSKDEKEALRLSLLQEQGFLCAYCMRRIENNGSSTKIEHYEPRNNLNEMKYSNLLAVCHGNEGYEYKYQTCDTKKKDLLVSIDPQKETDITSIFYSNSGQINSTNKEFDKDINEVFNLNGDISLFQARKNKLQAFKENVLKKYSGKISSSKWQKLYDHYNTANSEGRKSAYCGIILWYIKRKLVNK